MRVILFMAVLLSLVACGSGSSSNADSNGKNDPVTSSNELIWDESNFDETNWG